MNSPNSPLTNMVSFWLVPDSAETELWQPIIDTLSDHYDAPRFIPHVTVAMCESSNPILTDRKFLSDALNAVARNTPPLTLTVGPVQCGENFFQCVFASLPTDPVRSIADALTRSLQPGCPDANMAPVSRAHLSLIYSNIKTSQREMLASQITAPSTTLRLDRLCAVHPGDGETDFSNPESWNICVETRLRSGAD